MLRMCLTGDLSEVRPDFPVLMPYLLSRATLLGGGSGGGTVGCSWSILGEGFPKVSCDPRVPKVRSISGSSRNSPFHLVLNCLYLLLFSALFCLFLSFRSKRAASLRWPRLFFPALCRVSCFDRRTAFPGWIEGGFAPGICFRCSLSFPEGVAARCPAPPRGGCLACNN